MPLDDLRKSIESEAREKARTAERQADSEVERILSQAKAKAEKMESDARSDAKGEAERMTKEHEASLEIEINNQLIQAREEVIDQEMESVEKQVESIIESDHMDEVLKMAIKSFGEAIPKEELTIKTRKENSKMVSNLGLRVEYIDIDGFTIYSSDRKIFLNVTAQSIVKANRDIIRNAVAKSLFGKEAGAHMASGKKSSKKD